MSYGESMETIQDAMSQGLEGHALVAFAILELSDSIARSFSTRYDDSNNALEVIAQMLGAAGDGGGEGRNVVGAINYLAEQVDTLRDDMNNRE